MSSFAKLDIANFSPKLQADSSLSAPPCTYCTSISKLTIRLAIGKETCQVSKMKKGLRFFTGFY